MVVLQHGLFSPKRNKGTSVDFFQSVPRTGHRETPISAAGGRSFYLRKLFMVDDVRCEG